MNMLDFLFSILRLVALAGCLVLIRAVSLDYFIKKRIFRTRGVDYYRNNRRRKFLDNYLFVGFKNVLPDWLYLYNLGFTAFCAAVWLFMFLGFAFGAAWLVKIALWLFMYAALLAVILNLLYNLPERKLVLKWSFFGLYGALVANIPLTAILWSICF